MRAYIRVYIHIYLHVYRICTACRTCARTALPRLGVTSAREPTKRATREQESALPQSSCHNQTFVHVCVSGTVASRVSRFESIQAARTQGTHVNHWPSELSEETQPASPSLANNSARHWTRQRRRAIHFPGRERVVQCGQCKMTHTCKCDEKSI